VLEINPDLGIERDGDEGEVGRVRDVEPEPAAAFRTEPRLAEGVVHEA